MDFDELCHDVPQTKQNITTEIVLAFQYYIRQQ
ncbi:hypothetical protein PPEP_a6004 [Pseudoalteromonas peptidolytica F12-50-A1]|uniref:Uncharacterized protein n=1 Tax=Pseudoalteromonas peptidolytica F12-50-A1 TaxID=1315280 RepID=A0A8I0MVD7_9GAMM|nr:hypothetical protein [Pseudoalteromonas peptidolytica F12-50-A1]